MRLDASDVLFFLMAMGVIAQLCLIIITLGRVANYLERIAIAMEGGYTEE